MTSRQAKHGKPWTKEDESALKELVEQSTPTRVMAVKLQRTEESVRSRAQGLGISLKTINQSPRGTRT